MKNSPSKNTWKKQTCLDIQSSLQIWHSTGQNLTSISKSLWKTKNENSVLSGFNKLRCFCNTEQRRKLFVSTLCIEVFSRTCLFNTQKGVRDSKSELLSRGLQQSVARLYWMPQRDPRIQVITEAGGLPVRGGLLCLASLQLPS